jgi:hypothetical protein
MADVVSSLPVVIGGALVIPQGLLAQLRGETTVTVDADARKRVEQIAMQAVIAVETGLGHTVKDVSAEKCGWDITSQPPKTSEKLAPARHIEVKGRAKGQTAITVSRNEIIYGLNQTEQFILAVVLVEGDSYKGPYYLKNPLLPRTGIRGWANLLALMPERSPTIWSKNQCPYCFLDAEFLELVSVANNPG